MILILSFDHSTSVSEYRDSVVKMRDFYRGKHGEHIMPSHHKLPVKDNIFERYIDLCNKTISGKKKGVYKDLAYCRGLCVKGNGIQMVYNKV